MPAVVEDGRAALRKMPVFTPVSVRVTNSWSPVVVFVTTAVMVWAVVELVLASASVTFTKMLAP